MNKIWGIALAFTLVGVLMGYGVGNWQTQQAVEDAYAQGMAYQQSITPTTTPTGTPASLDVDFDNDVYDHTGTVDADGAVASDTDVYHTITIENTDETRTASDVYIMLYNPISDKDGLDSELEVEETYVFLKIGGYSKALYNDKEYSDGYLIGDLAPGDKVEIEVHVTLQEADTDTYVDGQSYDCNLYVYQPDANYVDPIDFTINT